MQANFKSLSPANKPRQAFTLIELLVSMSVLALLMVMVFQMVDQTQKTWNVARSRVSQFRESRAAFEAVTRNLQQATLNPYWDYDYGNYAHTTNQTNPTVPRDYQRQSELHFVSGPSADLLASAGVGSDRRPGHAVFFQIPGGFGVKEQNSQFSDLLNARGYFVEYGDDSLYKPSFLNSQTKPKHRFRLMEFRPPTETLQLYMNDLKGQGTSSNPTALREWFVGQLGDELGGATVVRPIADNIIAAFFIPKFPESDTGGFVLAPDYIYDSRKWQSGGSANNAVAKFSKNQLPPLMEVVMVAVDEKSMIRYQAQNSDSLSTMPDFVPSGLFTSYSNYRSFQDDLEQLETALDSKKIGFRVFSQTVPMRGAGWSQSS